MLLSMQHTFSLVTAGEPEDVCLGTSCNAQHDMLNLLQMWTVSPLRRRGAGPNPSHDTQATCAEAASAPVGRQPEGAPVY